MILLNLVIFLSRKRCTAQRIKKVCVFVLLFVIFLPPMLISFITVVASQLEIKTTIDSIVLGEIKLFNDFLSLLFFY